MVSQQVQVTPSHPSLTLQLRTAPGVQGGQSCSRAAAINPTPPWADQHLLTCLCVCKWRLIGTAGPPCTPGTPGRAHHTKLDRLGLKVDAAAGGLELNLPEPAQAFHPRELNTLTHMAQVQNSHPHERTGWEWHQME